MSNLINVLVPDIDGSVKVSKVLKGKGSLVKKYDVIALCESDLIEVEIKSYTAGVIEEILVKKGDEVSSKSIIATLMPSENSGNKEIVNDVEDYNEEDVEENKKIDVIKSKSKKKNKKRIDKSGVEKESFEIDKDSIIKKEEIVNIIKSKNDDIEEIGRCAEISKNPYRIVPFLKNLFGLSKSETVNNNLYEYYRYLDLSYIVDSLEEFSDDYKNLFGQDPQIDPFFIKAANIVLKKTEYLKTNRVNYIYKTADKTIKNYIDNISKKQYHEIQEIVLKEGNIKNSNNILKIIFNYKNGFMKSNNENCIVLNAFDNNKNIIASYSSLLENDNGFYDAFFRYLENPAWIMLDIMV